VYYITTKVKHPKLVQ